MSSRPEFLLCAPDFFDVEYVINPWMEGNIHRPSRENVVAQWNALSRLLAAHADVTLAPAQPGLPDMVFTANAGLVLGEDVVLSRFMHPERRGEEQHFKQWFDSRGFTVHELPRDLPFEGAGDALLDRAHGVLWAGYGFRSELSSHPFLAESLQVETLSLRLIDKRFYHLDTCFCPLDGGYLLYYPAAFDAYSNRLIESRVEAGKRIAIGEADAVNFACNAVNIGRVVVLNKGTPELVARLRAEGFQPVETPLTEFLKSGGAAKCLTLRLTEPPLSARQHAMSPVVSRVMQLEGHLLDSGLLDRALEATIENGGSFQILDFALGHQRQSTSKAEIKITAPASEVLEKIIAQLIDLGGLLPPEEVGDAELRAVSQSGVAPDDFHATTIYPTEVRVGGKWCAVNGQRMDGVIAIDESSGAPVARCQLIRDLLPGSKVVVGIKGIRTVRKTESRDLARQRPRCRRVQLHGRGSFQRAARRVGGRTDRMGVASHP